MSDTILKIGPRESQAAVDRQARLVAVFDTADPIASSEVRLMQLVHALDQIDREVVTLFSDAPEKPDPSRKPIAVKWAELQAHTLTLFSDKQEVQAGVDGLRDLDNELNREDRRIEQRVVVGYLLGAIERMGWRLTELQAELADPSVRKGQIRAVLTAKGVPESAIRAAQWNCTLRQEPNRISRRSGSCFFSHGRIDWAIQALNAATLCA